MLRVSYPSQLMNIPTNITSVYINDYFYEEEFINWHDEVFTTDDITTQMNNSVKHLSIGEFTNYDISHILPNELSHITFRSNNPKSYNCITTWPNVTSITFDSYGLEYLNANLLPSTVKHLTINLYYDTITIESLPDHLESLIIYVNQDDNLNHVIHTINIPNPIMNPITFKSNIFTPDIFNFVNAVEVLFIEPLIFHNGNIFNDELIDFYDLNNEFFNCSCDFYFYTENLINYKDIPYITTDVDNIYRYIGSMYQKVKSAK